jgi:nuclear protein localization family protein 4
MIVINRKRFDAFLCLLFPTRLQSSPDFDCPAELPIDIEYYDTDGRVKGVRSVLCQHSQHSKCTHCLDTDVCILFNFIFHYYYLQPWDESYLKTREIKHASFHSELKRLTQKVGPGKRTKYPLENVNCKVDVNCAYHEPYPKALCSRCQPGAVTLNRQVCFTFAFEY